MGIAVVTGALADSYPVADAVTRVLPGVEVVVSCAITKFWPGGIVTEELARRPMFAFDTVRNTVVAVSAAVGDFEVSSSDT